MIKHSKHSEETKRKISLRHKGHHHSISTEFKKGQKSYIRTEKHREICRQNAKKRFKELWQNPKYREQLSNLQKERMKDPEFKKKSTKSIIELAKQQKGKKKSEESCRRMSIAQKGKPKYRLRGKNHWAWKGGISRCYKSGRLTLEHKNWRRTIFIRDEFTCQECGKKHTYIEAHHIKSWAHYPELRFDINNGTTLCKECHKKTNNYRAKNLWQSL